MNHTCKLAPCLPHFSLLPAFEDFPDPIPTSPHAPIAAGSWKLKQGAVLSTAAPQKLFSAWKRLRYKPWPCHGV